MENVLFGMTGAVILISSVRLSNSNCEELWQTDVAAAIETRLHLSLSQEVTK